MKKNTVMILTGVLCLSAITSEAADFICQSPDHSTPAVLLAATNAFKARQKVAAGVECVSTIEAHRDLPNNSKYLCNATGKRIIVYENDIFDAYKTAARVLGPAAECCYEHECSTSGPSL